MKIKANMGGMFQHQKSLGYATFCNIPHENVELINRVYFFS